MEKLTVRIGLFAALNIGLCALALTLIEARYEPGGQGESDAVLYHIPENEEFDLVILGSSHAKSLSSYHNHERVERILGMKVLNLAKVGAGVVPERALLSYFYARGNRAKRVLIFMDYFVFLNAEWNEGHPFVRDEPFHPRFVGHLINVGMLRRIVYDYLVSKFDRRYIFRKSGAAARNDASVAGAPPAEMVVRARALFSRGHEVEVFRRYVKVFLHTVNLAERQRARVYLIVPPQIFRVRLRLPNGQEPWLLFLALVQKTYGIRVHDFSNSIGRKDFFADHDHLNTAGVEFFTERFLKPLLTRGR